MIPEVAVAIAIGVALGGVAIATEWFDFGDSQKQAAAPGSSVAQTYSPGQQPQLAEAVKRAEDSSHRSVGQPAGRAGWNWQSDGRPSQR